MDRNKHNVFMNKTQMLNPGPGAYEPKPVGELLSRNDSPKYGFGTAERMSLTNRDTAPRTKS